MREKIGYISFQRTGYRYSGFSAVKLGVKPHPFAKRGGSKGPLKRGFRFAAAYRVAKVPLPGLALARCDRPEAG